MEIKKELINSALIISLTGRLDTTTAPDLEEVLDSSLEGITELELNMAGVPYVSSAGLRVMMAAMKRMKKQGPMKKQLMALISRVARGKCSPQGMPIRQMSP